MTHKKHLSFFALVAFAILIGCMGPKPVQMGNEAYQAGDMTTAQQQYQVGLDGGDPEAVLAMAIMYAEGAGVPQDGDKAIRMMQDAMAQGSVQAATSLGVCHYYGLFVPQDYTKAAGYFAHAIMEGGDYLAVEYLVHMLNNGIGVENNTEMALNIQDLAPLP